MARRKAKRKSKRRESRFQPLRFVRRWLVRLVVIVAGVVILVVAAHRIITPPETFYMGQEKRRLGEIDYLWTPIDQIAPAMARSVVAAEDANFCQHWGFDMGAIRAAISDGSARGASTVTQQVVKNVYLWHGRSWSRKALEALFTPVVEVFWPKRRIIEVYLNVAEFGEGVFGVEAAARRYFSVGPEELSDIQAARLAAVLPAPKTRSAARPTAALRKRSAAIMDGAATILKDGRSACFED